MFTLEQLTIFGEFEAIDNLHLDNMISIAAMNWTAKFKITRDPIHKRRVDFYCSSWEQLREIADDLKAKGWAIHKETMAFPGIEFCKADMLIGIIGVCG